MIRVFLPTQLDSYTGGQRDLEIACDAGWRLDDLLLALDKRYPGVRFRLVDEQGQIRRHIAMFIGENMVRAVDVPLHDHDRVQIVGALSGG